MIQIISHRVSLSKIVELIFQGAVQFLILFLRVKRQSFVILVMFLLVAPHALQMSPHPQLCVPPQSLLLLVVRVMQKSVLMLCYLMMLLCCHPIMIVLVDFIHSFVILCVLRRQIYSVV